MVSHDRGGAVGVMVGDIRLHIHNDEHIQLGDSVAVHSVHHDRL